MEENLEKKLWVLYSALNRYIKEYRSYQKEEEGLAKKLDDLKKAATVEDTGVRHQVTFYWPIIAYFSNRSH